MNLEDEVRCPLVGSVGLGGTGSFTLLLSQETLRVRPVSPALRPPGVCYLELVGPARCLPCSLLVVCTHPLGQP